MKDLQILIKIQEKIKWLFFQLSCFVGRMLVQFRLLMPKQAFLTWENASNGIQEHYAGR